MQSDQRHHNFDIFRKLIPVHPGNGQQQNSESGQGELQTEYPGLQGKISVQYPPLSQLALGKTKKGRSLLGVDHTHKLTITFLSNYQVRLRSLK